MIRTFPILNFFIMLLYTIPSGRETTRYAQIGEQEVFLKHVLSPTFNSVNQGRLDQSVNKGGSGGGHDEGLKIKIQIPQ